MKLEEVRAALAELDAFELPRNLIEYDRRGFIKTRQQLPELISRLIRMTAAFVRSLEAARADIELARRVTALGDLTGPNSALEKSRQAAYDCVARAIKRFKLPDGSYPACGLTKKRARVSLTGSSPRSLAWDRVANEWPRFERFRGDINEIIWNVADALRYADWLLKVTTPVAKPEGLKLWRDQLFHFSAAVDAGQLLGCRLIGLCGDALHDRKCSYDAYQDVTDVLKNNLPERLRAVKEAAASLFRSALERQQGAQNAQKPIRSITMSVGERSYTMETDGAQPLSFSDEEKPIIALVAQKIAAGAPTELVPLKALHLAIHEVNPDRRTFSDRLRQTLLRLNKRVRKAMGRLPDDMNYLESKKGKGIHLTALVEWRITDKFRAVLSPSSAWAHPADINILAETQPDRGQKLPARSRHREAKDDENDDQD
ncbi:MAG: hypothetical protein FJ271_09585 [Planctomycetes bacterium]|nr:hypothetical protein [Planctomycetota bacterium]